MPDVRKAGRPRGTRRDHEARWMYARTLYDEGLPVKEIGRLTGVRHVAVVIYAKRHGWPRRLKGGRKDGVCRWAEAAQNAG